MCRPREPEVEQPVREAPVGRRGPRHVAGDRRQPDQDRSWRQEHLQPLRQVHRRVHAGDADRVRTGPRRRPEPVDVNVFPPEGFRGRLEMGLRLRELLGEYLRRLVGIPLAPRAARVGEKPLVANGGSARIRQPLRRHWRRTAIARREKTWLRPAAPLLEPRPPFGVVVGPPQEVAELLRRWFTGKNRGRQGDGPRRERRRIRLCDSRSRHQKPHEDEPRTSCRSHSAIASSKTRSELGYLGLMSYAVSESWLRT